MASPVIQFKRGAFANLPGLQAGEPALTTDTFELYVGIDSTTTNNKFFGSHRYWTREGTTTGSGVNLVEGSSNGSSYITLKSPDSLAGVTTYTFPATATADYYLKTAADGTLSWAAAPGASGTFSGIVTFSDTTNNTLGNENTGSVQFDGGVGIAKNLTVKENLHVGGYSNFVGVVTFQGGTINLGDTTGDDINVGGEFISGLFPNTTATYDLGDGTRQWRHGNFSGIVTASTGVVADGVQIGINGANVIDTVSGNLTINSAGGQTIIDDLVTIQNNLTVNGNITVGGTTVTLRGTDVFIENKDIILGFTTSVTPNDDTANHAGVAIASTVGTPLVNFDASGINTLPNTYKQLMWFKSGTLGFSTDAFAFNYGVAIGTTNMANGVRFAVGPNITFTDNAINSPNINISGVTTFTNASGTNLNFTGVGTVTTINVTNLIPTRINSSGVSTLTTLLSTNLQPTNINASGITTLSNATGTNLNFTGVSTATTLNSTVATLTNAGGTNLNFTGVSTLTNARGTNLNFTGVGTISTLYSTSGEIDNLYTDVGIATVIRGTNLNYTGIGTIATLNSTVATLTNAGGTNLNFTGVSTATTLNSTVATLTNAGGTNLNFTGVSTLTNATGTNINFSGIGTVTTLNVTNLIPTRINSSGVSTLTTLNSTVATLTNAGGTNLNFTGIGTIATLNSTVATLTNAGGTNLNFTGVSTLTNANGTNLNFTGIGTLANLRITSQLYDGANSTGADGQFLTRTASGIGWTTIAGVAAGTISTATRAQTADVTATNAQSGGIVFATAGTGATLYNDADLSYNSNTNQLNVGILSATTEVRTGAVKAADGTSAISITNSTGAVQTSNDLTVSGNLYVSGNTTQVNTAAITVEDRTIELGVVDGSAPSTTTTWDLGVLFNYHDGAAKKSALVWEQGDARFKLGSVVSDGGGTGNSNPQITFTTYAPLEIGALWVNDCAGQSQVISCSGSTRKLENITIDAGTF